VSWLGDGWRRLFGKRLVISMDIVDVQSDGNASRWPPTAADVERLQRYESYLKLFLGRHEEVFDPYRRPDDGPYVTTNILGGIARLTVHRLFGELAKARVKGRFEFGDSSSELSPTSPPPPTRGVRPTTLHRQQQLLDFLCQSNAWQQLCYQGALGGSYRGDSVFKVRYDAGRDAVVLEEVPPSLFFPELAADQQEEVVAVSLAWIIDPSPDSPLARGRGEAPSRVAWLREEYHTPGRIENRLWKLVSVPGQSRYLRRPAELSALEATADLPEVADTGLDVIPIVHIPNRKVAETGVWGQSDYADLLSLQEALNRRKTQTGSILDKHADPLLAIDESFLDESGRLPMDRIRAIPLVQDEPPPQYVTWDGKLSDSRAEADDLVHKILLVAGISPESFGFGTGGGPESGRAIRLRQMLTTSTVAGKRLLWGPGLQRLLSIATKMFVIHVRNKRRHGLGRVKPLDPDQISIEFGEGLPRDIAAVIEDEVALQKAALASKRASLRRLFPGWSEADIDAEIERLEAPSPDSSAP
jgi:hypothetical protein